MTIVGTRLRADSPGVLGPDHPLVRVMAQISMAEWRCLAVSAALVAGVCALVVESGLGAAGAQLLVTDGLSPLYGHVEVTLRQELGRIRFLPASRDP